MPVRDCIGPPGGGWLRADSVWGHEHAMRDAVLNTGAWEVLFEHAPRPEVRSGDGFQRYDLISYKDRKVAEFKLDANPATLAQLNRYLEYLGSSRHESWTGCIVWGNSCSHTLVERVEEREDVQLWRCDRGFRDEPELECEVE